MWTVNLMTASLTAGDAIGNYCLTLQTILGDLGCKVLLYADHFSPEMTGVTRPSTDYSPGKSDILWFHYSIFADNLSQVDRPAGFKIMDFHGISPHHLFAGVNRQMEELCRLGDAQLPRLRNSFDLCVVHSEYSRDVLQSHGYSNIVKLPLVVDSSRFDGSEDETLSKWLRQLEYLLFVGRIVPQKGIEHLLEFFSAVRQERPNVKLFLVGNQDLAPAYQRRLTRLVRRLRLRNELLFTGSITDPKMLTSFFRHARFSVFLSEWESFCVPIVESMSFGTPVIGRNIPPIPETMGGGGILVDIDRLDEAATRIAEIWDDSEQYSSLQQAGRSQVERYTDRQLHLNVAQLLERVMGQGR